MKMARHGTSLSCNHIILPKCGIYSAILLLVYLECVPPSDDEVIAVGANDLIEATGVSRLPALSGFNWGGFDPKKETA